MQKRYITTTLPYVNASPHIGFALELAQADTLARYWRGKGDTVFFNTGTDEHGVKVYRKAAEEHKNPQAYVDECAEEFRRLSEALGVDTADFHFIRTTDERHMRAAQEFWRRCEKNGDIEKKLYKTKYCVGCELEKTDSELADGKCPIHPALAIEEREEENYFFKFSRYGEKLLALYGRFPAIVIPDYRLAEIRNFVQNGLKDFSISRLKEKMPWGIPVPGDEEHVMYVWFDALVNYVSTLGWPEDGAAFASYWGTDKDPKAVQFAGKDNLRQQSAMWQAMLMSAGLPPSRHIFIHGFVTSGGEKISKSSGNTVDPFAIAKKYGSEALRYWLLREISAFGDGDFTWEKFHERYTADLANGLGNFSARVLALAERAGGVLRMHEVHEEVAKRIARAREEREAAMERYAFHEALGAVWGLVAFGDAYINREEPWKRPDAKVLFSLVVMLDNVAALIAPFLPRTAENLSHAIVWHGEELVVKKGEALFPRIMDHAT